MEKFCKKHGTIEEYDVWGRCKKCWTRYMKKYSKDYYEGNKKGIKEKQAAYREAHKEEKRIYSAKYNSKKEVIERKKELGQKYRKENPEKLKAKDHRRRSLKLGAEGSYTAQEWKDLLADYGGKCAYSFVSECGGRIGADHIVPLSGGGTNYIDNIVPACLIHNTSKYNTPLLVWLWRKLNIG